MLWRRLGWWVAGIYLATVATGAAIGFAEGDLGPYQLAVLWLPQDVLLAEFVRPDPVVAVAGLTVVAGLKAWLFQQIFTVPGRRARPADRRVVWLRRLLYLAVAEILVLWLVTYRFPDLTAEAVAGALWAPLYVLFVLVLDWRSAVLRGLALVTAGLAALSVAGPALDEIPGVDVPEVLYMLAMTGLLWQVLILVGQWRDGRWSDTTVNVGRVSLVLSLITMLLEAGLQAWLDRAAPDTIHVAAAVGVFHAVWLVRSAHELAGPETTGTPAGGGPSPLIKAGAVAAVLLLLLPLTFVSEAGRQAADAGHDAGPNAGWDDVCGTDRIGQLGYGDARPEDREKVFLCRTRFMRDGFPPLFPSALSDEDVLAYGRRLCTARDEAEKLAVLSEAGSTRGWGVEDETLVFLCPDVVGARKPDLLLSAADQAEKMRAESAADEAELAAQCTDPWPGVRAAAQRTGVLDLGEVGAYAVHDYADEAGEEDVSDVTPKGGLVAAEGSTAFVLPLGESGPVCLTVKAFATRPPLRLKGWEYVAEVGVLSRTGHLGVPEHAASGGGEEAETPPLNAAIKGAGRYRLRVYAGGSGPLEQHLLVIYPGRSARHVQYRGLT
ncbi:hypothetical protein HII36_42045 [Nonomuraea sp. NN258]|uniref:hypothetical protein n=1 Tax=Nonomuraea antri TaxID=2730852 RepID=UPI001568CDCD|nr:hypothetical protein [Nonomuraea antri]NRQ38367.1 hypothetical protein [Nonomuraea antri]